MVGSAQPFQVAPATTNFFPIQPYFLGKGVAFMREKLDDKKIYELIEDGWHFSIKKTGKYRYLRRRRKGSPDVNMGPYDEAVWEKIQKMQGTTAQPRIDHRIVYRLRNELHYQLTIERARERPKTCIHVRDQFCTFWRWKPDGHIFLTILAQLEEQSEKLWSKKRVSTIADGDGKLLVKASLDYCKDCTEYVRGEVVHADAS